MSQQFTANYFFTTNQFGPNEVRQVTLIDIDLERRNTAGELVTRTGAQGEIFDGFPFPRAGQPNFFEQVSGEATITVTFNDGISLSGVLGTLEQATFSFGGFTHSTPGCEHRCETFRSVDANRTTDCVNASTDRRPKTRKSSCFRNSVPTISGNSHKMASAQRYPPA